MPPMPRFTPGEDQRYPSPGDARMPPMGPTPPITAPPDLRYPTTIPSPPPQRPSFPRDPWGDFYGPDQGSFGNEG